MRSRAERSALACRRPTTALAAANERHRSAPETFSPGTWLRDGRYPPPPVPTQWHGRRPVIVPAGVFPKPPGSLGDEPKARKNRSRSTSRRDRLASWYVSEIVPARNYYDDGCQEGVAATVDALSSGGTRPAHSAGAASSAGDTEAIAWNTPSRRTSAWNSAAATCNRISAKNAKAR